MFAMKNLNPVGFLFRKEWAQSHRAIFCRGLSKLGISEHYAKEDSLSNYDNGLCHRLRWARCIERRFGFVRNKSNEVIYASYTLTSDARLLHIGTTTIAPGTTRHIFNFHRPVNYGAPPELEKGVRSFTLLDSSAGILHGPKVDKDEWKEECPPQSKGVNRCNTLNYVFEYE